ncbi:Copia protein, partial [Mucuna pruriens]
MLLVKVKTIATKLGIKSVTEYANQLKSPLDGIRLIQITWVFLLKHKFEISNVFQNFFSMFKNQFGVSIKKLRSNNGKEYFNQKKQTPLPPNLSIFVSKKCSKKFFLGEGVLTTTYLINRLPSRILVFKSPMNVFPPKSSKVSLLDTPILRKGISVAILHPRNFVSWDATFREEQNYFTQSYLQEESLREDKEILFENLVFPTLKLNSRDLT